MIDFALNNGLKIPAIGLGTWKSGPNEVYNAVKYALKIGYNHVDCASIYENQEEIGRAFKESFAENYINRDKLWVTSKLWCNSFKSEKVEAALDKTLQDLKLDYLDLYLIHWPIAFKEGVMMPQGMGEFELPEEKLHLQAWEVLESCLKKGKVKSIGISNFGQTNLNELLNNCNVIPAVNQIELHPLLQQEDLLASCAKHSIHVTAYSPLGSLDRPDFLKLQDEPILLEHPEIANIANDLGVSPAQVLISWAVSRGTSVIPKSVNPSRIEENLKSAEISLDQEAIERINKLDKGYRFVNGSIFAGDHSPYQLNYLWD